MGVNVLEKTGPNEYLVGSFEGLFIWNSESGAVFDYIRKKPLDLNSYDGRSAGEYLVAGFTRDYKGREYFFDYDKGATGIDDNEQFAGLPQKITDEAPISLWNVALEIHTGRIYEPIIGGFYVLVVPFTGLILLFILISGFIVWLKIRRKTDY
jgi:hypothetical protein